MAQEIRGVLFGRGSRPEISRIGALLRKEVVGGVLLLLATVAALIWANSPWSDSYTQLSNLRVGPSAVHLFLSLKDWAADGLLAIFFFVAGLELKREFVVGDLRNPRRAAVPVAAAVGGMAVPAVMYLVVNRNSASGSGALTGWAIPTATDIAFALAVLAVIGTHLPSALHTFLLTLAVVDDLLAITIIALFYTKELHIGWLALAVIPLAGFTFAVQLRIRWWWLLLPLAIITWALVHASGIHATVAGVLLGFAVPVRSGRSRGDQIDPGLAEHFEHRFRPLSAGLAVPVFAFFAAGVSVGGWSGLGGALSDRVTLGIVLALVVGKPVGVLAGTAITSAALRMPLAAGLKWLDVVGLSLVAGVGFTVSLLIGELAFGSGSARDDHVKVGVLVGSFVAAGVAAIILRLRNRSYRKLSQQESGPVQSATGALGSVNNPSIE